MSLLVLNVPWFSALKKCVGVKKAVWLIIQVPKKFMPPFLSSTTVTAKKCDSKTGNGWRKQSPKKRKN